MTASQRPASRSEDRRPDDDFSVGMLSGPEWDGNSEPGAGGATPPPPQDNAAAAPPVPEDNSPGIPGTALESDSTDQSMTLMEHLNELRRRLTRCCIAAIVGFLACWTVVEPIFNALTEPLLRVLPAGSHAIYTTLPEGFFTRMYIAFVAGVFATSPYIFYQIWAFIAPGLYDEEKRFIVPIAMFSALFFVAGGSFCYFIVFPYAFTFFVSFATESIVAMPKISDYLGFVLKLILAFGLIFEMPLFAFFLARMGIVTAAMMRRVRRYAVLAIFIVAAILTPPDVVSQLLMACPMLILYECSILIAAACGRKSGPEEKGAKPRKGKTAKKETKTEPRAGKPAEDA